jgi:starch phosphorylase
MFKSIHDEILYHGDRYFNAADLDSYIKMQEQVDVEYAQPMLWARKCLLNIARMGKFSSDRTIRQYSQDIWNVKPCL